MKKDNYNAIEGYLTHLEELLNKYPDVVTEPDKNGRTYLDELYQRSSVLVKVVRDVLDEEKDNLSSVPTNNPPF